MMDCVANMLTVARIDREAMLATPVCDIRQVEWYVTGRGLLARVRDRRRQEWFAVVLPAKGGFMSLAVNVETADEWWAVSDSESAARGKVLDMIDVREEEAA